MNKRVMGKEMHETVRTIQDCSAICTETVQYCVKMGGRHVEPTHLRLLLDCAEICQTNTNFMLRESLFHYQMSNVCAEVCEVCAADCEKFVGDAQMKACAEVCRLCAEACHRLAAMPVGV